MDSKKNTKVDISVDQKSFDTNFKLAKEAYKKQMAIRNLERRQPPAIRKLERRLPPDPFFLMDLRTHILNSSK